MIINNSPNDSKEGGGGGGEVSDKVAVWESIDSLRILSYVE